MLKQFGGFIAWLSGSLAGITAGLYALGFVATMGTDQLLGIGSEFTSRDPGFYIGRGGNLVMRTALIGIWPVLALIVVTAAFRWLAAKLALAQRRFLAPVGWLADSAVAPLTALVMFALALSAIVFVLQPALNVAGLLFATEIPTKICEEDHGLRRAILAQDRETLNLWFDAFALGAGALVGLGVVARTRLTRAGEGLWLAVAGLAGLLTLVAIPLAYGILVVQTDPPEVRIEPQLDGTPESVRLLSRSDGGMLVWLEAERHVRWVSARGIESVTVVGPGEAIRTLRCFDERATTEEGD